MIHCTNAQKSQGGTRPGQEPRTPGAPCEWQTRGSPSAASQVFMGAEELSHMGCRCSTQWLTPLATMPAPKSSWLSRSFKFQVRGAQVAPDEVLEQNKAEPGLSSERGKCLAVQVSGERPPCL